MPHRSSTELKDTFFPAVLTFLCRACMHALVLKYHVIVMRPGKEYGNEYVPLTTRVLLTI